jgi:hypothetical protein
MQARPVPVAEGRAAVPGVAPAAASVDALNLINHLLHFFSLKDGLKPKLLRLLGLRGRKRSLIASMRLLTSPV